MTPPTAAAEGREDMDCSRSQPISDAFGTTERPAPSAADALLIEKVAQAFADLNAGPWQTFRQEAEAAVRIVLGAAPSQWRCFHCDFVTSDRDEAEQHFGPKSFYDPTCRMTDTGQRREYTRLDAAYTRVCEAKKAAEARVAELEAEAILWREHDARAPRLDGPVTAPLPDSGASTPALRRPE